MRRIRIRECAVFAFSRVSQSWVFLWLKIWIQEFLCWVPCVHMEARKVIKSNGKLLKPITGRVPHSTL